MLNKTCCISYIILNQHLWQIFEDNHRIFPEIYKSPPLVKKKIHNTLKKHDWENWFSWAIIFRIYFWLGGYTGHFLFLRLLTLIFFLTNIRQTQKWKNFEKNWFKKFSARFNGFGSKNKKSTKNSNKLWYIMMVVGMAFKVFKTITLSLVFALKGQVWAWHWANSESYYVLYVYRFVRSKLTFLNRVQTEINK